MNLETEYFMKTCFFPPVHSEDNTWEPEENLDCPDLIAEFLQSQKSAQDGKRKAAGDSEGDESKSKKKKDDVSLSSCTQNIHAIVIVSITLKPVAVDWFGKRVTSV